MWAPSYPNPAGTAPAPTAPDTAGTARDAAPTAPGTAATAPITRDDVATLAGWLEGRGVLVTSAVLGGPDRVCIEVWNTRGPTMMRHDYGPGGVPLRKNAPKRLTRTMAAAFAALAADRQVAA